MPGHPIAEAILPEYGTSTSECELRYGVRHTSLMEALEWDVIGSPALPHTPHRTFLHSSSSCISFTLPLLSLSLHLVRRKRKRSCMPLLAEGLTIPLYLTLPKAVIAPLPCLTVTLNLTSPAATTRTHPDGYWILHTHHHNTELRIPSSDLTQSWPPSVCYCLRWRHGWQSWVWPRPKTEQSYRPTTPRALRQKCQLQALPSSS